MKNDQRLHGEAAIRTLFQRGRRLETSYFRCIFKRNGGTNARFMVVVSKAVDKRAVKRNALRRKIREWLRQLSGLSAHPLDIGIIVKKSAINLSRKALYEELERCANRISKT